MMISIEDCNSIKGRDSIVEGEARYEDMEEKVENANLKSKIKEQLDVRE